MERREIAEVEGTVALPGAAAGAHVVGVLTSHTAGELHAAHELVADVAAWLRDPSRPSTTPPGSR